MPDELIKSVDLDELPAGWEANRRYAQPFGDAWFKARESVGLLVPSVVVPEEKNLLINPEHPDFPQVRYEFFKLLDVDGGLLPSTAKAPEGYQNAIPA